MTPKLAMLRRDHVHQKLVDARFALGAVLTLAEMAKQTPTTKAIVKLASEALEATRPLAELDPPQRCIDPISAFEPAKEPADWTK